MQPNTRISNVNSRRLSRVSAILFLSFSVCLGQAPSGTFTLTFDPTNTPLIDLSGSFQASQNIIGAGGAQIPLSFSLADLTNTASGRVRGSGTAIAQVGEDFVAANYTARGVVSGGGFKPVTVWLSVRLTGTGTVGGQETGFSIFVTYRLTFNPSDGMLEGTARGFASFAKFGPGRIRDDFITVPMPSGVDGSWGATLTIVPFRRLGGTGTISLPNGRTLPGTLSGNFFPFSGASRIRFTGTGDGRGVFVTFTTTSTEEGLQLETVRGIALGQRLHE